MSDIINVSEITEKSSEIELGEKLVAKISGGSFTHELSKPVMVGGETFTKVKIDFTKLSTDDVLTAAKNYKIDIASNEYPLPFLLHIAALAAEVPVAAIREFPYIDGAAFTLWAQLFLMKAASNATNLQ